MVESVEKLPADTAAILDLSQPGRLARFSKLLRRHPRLLIGGTILLILILLAIFAPFLPLQNPERGKATQAYQPPSLDHLFGTDSTGKDVLARVIFGSRVSLSVGFLAVSLGASVGIFRGRRPGWLGWVFDTLIMRLIDGLLAFPTLLLAISITAALGPNIQNVILAIGIINIPVFTRLSRGQTLQAKNREYVEAAHALGLSQSRILFRHIFPNIVNPLIVQASLSLAAAILAEASLSFLGLGAQPPTPTWGADINSGRAWLSQNYWWMVLGPGAAIMLTIYSFNLVGDSIRDILDPRSRKGNG